MRGKVPTNRLPELMTAIGLILTVTSQLMASYPANEGPADHSDSCCYIQNGGGSCTHIANCVLDSNNWSCNGLTYHCVDFKDSIQYGFCRAATGFNCTDYTMFYCASTRVYTSCVNPPPGAPCQGYLCDNYIWIVGGCPPAACP